MKKVRLFCTIIAILVAFAAGTAGPAMAEGWTFMHGDAATVQQTDRVNWMRTNVQGLDLDLKHGQAVNAHIAIQTPIVSGTNPSGTKADKIMLQIYTGSDLKVTKVLIYDAAWKIQEIVGDIQQASGYYFMKEIAIDSTHPFAYGLGITLEIAAGSNSSLDHRFCLATAGVHWLSTTGSSRSEIPDGLHAAEDQSVLELPAPPPPPPRGSWRR